MSRYICTRCRASLRRTIRAQKPYITSSIGAFSTKSQPLGCPKSEASSPSSTSNPSSESLKPEAPSKRKRKHLQPPGRDLDIAALLSKPTWSVRSLLPDSSTTPTQEISSKQLHHLLRLSALPLPKSPAEEESMLKTLHSQLHFVRDIQSVDTDGVEPLQSIREETEAGIKEATIGLEELRGVLEREDVKGRTRRPRRRRGAVDGRDPAEDWDVLETAGETVEVPGSGRFFVVRSGKE